MRLILRKSLVVLAVLASALRLVDSARADGPGPPTSTTARPPVPAPAMPADLARHVWEGTDVVLEHHIDPPSRQEMILSGLRALYRAAGVPVPLGLGRRASAIAAPGQLAATLAEAWPRTTSRPVSADQLEEALFGGLLGPVLGNAAWMTAKEGRVAEQMAGNRYVGIHVALSWDQDEGRPEFAEVFPGGPADRAGVRRGDRLEAVDGVDTKGKDLRAVVDRLRGDEGTAVTIAVRQPKESKARTMTMTRGQLPRATIEGIRKQATGGWVLRLEGPDPIGYLRIKEIAASTPHELRKLAGQMEAEGLRALVLDLRGPESRSGDTQVHAAALLADSLLESGAIGRLHAVGGATTYEADPDALFRGWPIAVLVDGTTSGVMEWVAAALQDNRRATVVGRPTRGAYRVLPGRGGEVFGEPIDAAVTSTVPSGDGEWAISLVTGYLERGDGRALANRFAAPPVASAPDPSPRGRSAIAPPSAGGVQPDHRLAGDEPNAPGRRKGAGMEGPVPLRRPGDRAYAAVEPDPAPRPPSGDPAIQAAATILHQALEKR